MRRFADEQALILSMVDCFHSGEKAIYCSSELTTGLRLYTALLEHGETDRHALKEKLGQDWLRDNVFVPNETSANALADEIQEKQNHTTISPAALFVPGWGQHDYLGFWETLIKTRVSQVWFNIDWQYSNGCTFEFASALEAKLPTFDREGNVLVPAQGLQLIQQAVEWLDTNGIDTTKLREHSSRIELVSSTS